MTHFANDVSTSIHQNKRAKRDVFPAMKKGFAQKCPKCGVGSVFGDYLKIVDECSHCGEELKHHRADDAPAYFTISIVGKLVVGFCVWFELAYQPPYWLHAVIWIPLLIAMALWFLPRIKGAIVGLQWANYMHGFDPNHREIDDIETAPADKLAERPAS